MSFSRLFNFILLFFLIVSLIKLVPSIYSRYQMEGTMDTTLKGHSGKKRVYVFWATWCPPCKVELFRLNQLVNLGLLDSENIIAVNMSEDVSLVNAYVKEKGYLFNIEFDPMGELAQAYHVDTTPSVFFVDETDKIIWATSGLSPSLEIRVLTFFKEKEGFFWNLLKTIIL